MEEGVQTKMGGEKENEPDQHGVKDDVTLHIRGLRIGFFSGGDAIQYTLFIFNKYHVRCVLKEDFIYRTHFLLTMSCSVCP